VYSASANLAKVAKGNLCSGCGICQSITGGAVSVRLDQSGFLRPQQVAPISNEEEEKIGRICPGLSIRSFSPGGDEHPIWGKYVSVYVGSSSDRALRHIGSSGGGLSATLCFLIEANGVDGVVQIGASENNPICNETTISTSYAQIADAAGSRYAPSSPLASIETLRGNGKRYAFVGKPCDIAALRALIELDPEYKDTFPYLLSFFCAGVPSLKGGEEVVRQLGVDLRSVVSFRYRGNGWPGRATATLEDGGARSMSYHDSWGGILSNYVQHRCKICVDGTGDAADIVFADAWESDERGYPIFEERDGKSLILVRTPKGQEVLDGALGGRKIVAEPFDIADIERIQPGQASRRRALLARLVALRILGKPTPRYTGFTLLAAARTGSFRWSARNFLGMVRRVLLGRAP
jgi:coenzyme F420 hydrogenase subunit beta